MTRLLKASCMVLIFALCVLAPGGVGIAAEGPPSYEVMAIAPTDYRAVDIDDHGRVILSYHNGLATRGAIWLPAAAADLVAGLNDLGTPKGDSGEVLVSGIQALADGSSRVLGTAYTNPNTYFPTGYLWWNGRFHLDPYDYSGFGFSPSPIAMNSKGELAGQFGDLGCFPMIWVPNTVYGFDRGVHRLPTVANIGEGYASDINESGQIVGELRDICDAVSVSHLYLWLPEPAFGLAAGPHDLTPNLPDFDSAQPAGINNSGRIVGTLWRDSVGPINPEIYLWQNGSMTLLGALPGADRSSAAGINDADQVVGASGGRAVLWQNGQFFDLNDLIPSGSGWVLTGTAAINNGGEIVGRGILNGEPRPFLLKPSVFLVDGEGRELPAEGPPLR